MHWKTLHKKMERKFFYQKVSSKSTFVVYKIQLGIYYYIGVTTDLPERITGHRCAIRKAANCLLLGVEMPKVTNKFQRQSAVSLSKNPSTIEKRLKNMKFEVLHLGRVRTKRYAVESSYIKKHIDDWRCLNDRI